VLGADEVTGGLELGTKSPVNRPYLVLNMIATADGKATIAGRTRGLSSPADRALFHSLRAAVDCVMVGAGTARTERYGRLVRDSAVRRRRARSGLVPDPLACVVSGRLALPQDLPILQDKDSRVLVFTASAASVEAPKASVEYLRSDSPKLPLQYLTHELRSVFGVRCVLCEGGPTLNSHLLASGLVDELFLTVSPKVLGGGDVPTIVTGTELEAPMEMELVSVLTDGSDLFVRYKAKHDAVGATSDDG
jgi:riboflavin-specific deaminase-like protein